jgi:hypothetical protein
MKFAIALYMTWLLIVDLLLQLLWGTSKLYADIVT